MTELELKQNLSNIDDEELIQKAKDTICELAKTYGRSHRMSIPPSANDTDMLLMEIVNRYEKIVNKLPLHRLSLFSLPDREQLIEDATNYVDKLNLPQNDSQDWQEYEQEKLKYILNVIYSKDKTVGIKQEQKYKL